MSGGGRGVGRYPSLGKGGGGVVVTIQAEGLGKLLFGASFCVLPNSLLNKKNKKCFFILFCIRLALSLQVQPNKHNHGNVHQQGKNGFSKDSQ